MLCILQIIFIFLLNFTVSNKKPLECHIKKDQYAKDSIYEICHSKCVIYRPPKVKVIDLDEGMYNFGGIVQGCGECPSNKIPCRTCTKTACNKFKLINEDTTFCWEKEVIRACDINACHYAVINESIVVQGCDELKSTEKNIQLIECLLDLCNSKAEFERVLFCLHKSWDELEPKRKMCSKYVQINIIDEIKNCFVYRREDGKVLQGCGEKCPDNKESEFCKYCTTRNCNEEKLISKYCWTNNGKIETKGDIPCFMERTKTNEVNKGFGQCPSSSLTCKTCNKNLCNDGTDLPYSYCLKFDGKRAIGCDKLDCYISKDSKAGCGTCDENNIEKSCFDCKGLNCNEKSKLEKAVFCYEREENGNEKEGSRPCNSKICFISVDINKGSGSSKETILKKYTKQGCGTCSSTKIPCRTCNKDLCNTEKYFQEVKFCWIKEYAVECDLNKWNGFCYYTLKKDKVEQGCGNGSKIEFDVLNVKCDQQLCNTKELFDKTLFCLNKGKDEKTNKAIICKENCKVERNYEGKVEQKCGNCPNNTNSTDCNSCKGRFCNEEKLVYKHCLKNNGEICKTPFDSPCFMARIEGNEVSQGCGNCNKSTKSTCKECVTHRCNNPENVYFCKSKEGVKECTDSYCYIANNLDGSKDFNCGKCPEEIQTNCAQCNNNPLCNTEELLKNSFYCLEFTEVMQTMMEGFIGCESQCYVKRKTSGRIIQDCDLCGEKEENCFNCNTSYCNEEKYVDKQCWIKNKKLCNTPHDSYCFMERTENNEKRKGCGNCSTLACKKCYKNRCNDWNNINYYCYGFNGTKVVKECSMTEPDCFIVKINNKDEKHNHFHYNCGKCRATNEEFLNTKDSHLSKNINKTNINSLQCVECNKGPLCNTEEFFENQLFCWKKLANESEKTETTRICESQCFVYRDGNGNVTQNCGECPNDTSIDCATCNEKYCNEERLVRKQCYLTNGNICKTFDDFCFMERNSRNEINKGCGTCSSLACRKCLGNRCNDWKDKPYFCYSNESSNGVKECSESDESDCYIIELKNKDLYLNCGNCSISNPMFNESPCVDCNKSPLCNNKTFFESKLFCLEKSNKTNKIIKGNRICESECFVYRDKNGIVNQGCGNCSSFSDYIDCKTCKENNYCNNERIISKQCWEDNNKKCKIEFDSPCYIYRTPTNGVEKGCGECPFYTCKECNGHLCNKDSLLPYYCFGNEASYKECSYNDSYCYIAKIEINGDRKIEQFHYYCGKCPSNILNLNQSFQNKNIQIKNKLIKININNIQCAECNNSPACNADTFFESQLFCWEKEARKWKENKGKRVCEIGFCFIAVDKNEMGLVQGCGKCIDQHNMTKCSNCSTPLCNNETILPLPIKCHEINTNFQPYIKRNKTCHHIYGSCYIARDVFWRVEQNCGECPSKYENCVKCNKDFCNEESLLPLSTKTKSKITRTAIFTTTNKIEIDKINMTTKHFINSTAQMNKVQIKVIFNVIVLLYILMVLL